jgi:hypothetical protein
MGPSPLTDDARLLWSQHNVFNDVDHGWAQGQQRLQTLRGLHGVHRGKANHSTQCIVAGSCVEVLRAQRTYMTALNWMKIPPKRCKSTHLITSTSMTCQEGRSEDQGFDVYTQHPLESPAPTASATTPTATTLACDSSEAPLPLDFGHCT